MRIRVSVFSASQPPKPISNIPKSAVKTPANRCQVESLLFVSCIHKEKNVRFAILIVQPFVSLFSEPFCWQVTRSVDRLLPNFWQIDGSFCLVCIGNNLCKRRLQPLPPGTPRRQRLELSLTPCILEYLSS